MCCSLDVTELVAVVLVRVAFVSASWLLVFNFDGAKLVLFVAVNIKQLGDVEGELLLSLIHI